ncbi:MAG TPA: hypothetical protein VHN79_07745, partial [Lacunisphaera sp.]|nr:hypothetical protein [Lacunisphaera sp.]
EEQILPHMITHQRVDLPEVRSRIAEIENHFRHRLGWQRLRNLWGRRARSWSEPRPPALLRAEISRTESSSQPD